MADVTGPISTLSGAMHDVPDGTMCDEHPDRPAVARVQGETDSFGCEMHDFCQECLVKDREWEKSPEAVEWRKGQCEWCKTEATDLRDARDYEEGLSGRVYRVCGGCIKKQNEELRKEAEYYDDGRDVDDWNDEDRFGGSDHFAKHGILVDTDDYVRLIAACSARKAELLESGQPQFRPLEKAT